MPAPEYRASTRPLKAEGRTVAGYTTVWNVAYPIPGGLESMAPGSTVLDDLELTLGHDIVDGKGQRLAPAPVLASMRAGTLKAVVDETGLYVEAELDETDPDALSALAKLRRGDVRGLSVGMYVLEEAQVGGVREVRSASVFQAALVGRAANPAAEAELRAASEAGAGASGGAPAPARLIPYLPDAYMAWDDDEDIKCQACGRFSANDAKFCDQCGGPLTDGGEYTAEPDEVVVCPECKLLSDSDAKFCDQCGYKLIGSLNVTLLAAQRSALPTIPPIPPALAGRLH